MTDLATAIVNHADVGVSRIAGLMRNATKFKKFVALVLSSFDEIEACYLSNDPIKQTFSMITDLFTDVILSTAKFTSEVAASGSTITAPKVAVTSAGFVPSVINGVLSPRVRGAQLDLLGTLLNRDRLVATNVTLDERAYGIVLRATVARNCYTGVWDGANGFLDALNTIFSIGGSTVSVRAYQPYTMGIGVSVGRALQPAEAAIAAQFTSFLPLNQGVALDSFVVFDSANYFGYSDDPNARGWSEQTATSITPGGFWAESLA